MPAKKTRTPKNKGFQHAFAGTIYKPSNTNRLYIEYTNKAGERKRVATGLKADVKENWNLAKTMLARLNLERLSLSAELSAPTEKSVPAPTTTAVTFQAAWDEFLHVRCVNKLPKTVRTYQDSFKKIIGNVQETLSLEHVERYCLEFVRNTHLKNSSVNIHLRHFQVFINFCSQRMWLPQRNFYKEFQKTVKTKRIQVFEPQEIVAIVETCRKRGREELALLVEFLIETGFRIGQALTLEWSAVDKNVVYRVSKHGNRDEPFPLTATLRRILETVPRYSEKPDKVFFWENSSQSTLTRELAIIMQEADVNKNGRGWHTFRKTAATQWAERGIPVHEVQKLLGHSSVLVTTGYYVGVELDHLREKLEKTPPLKAKNLSDI